MSDAPPLFGVVAEGKTDYSILTSLVAALSGQDPVVSLIQPESSRTFQELGEGWKGVRNWCNQCKGYGGLDSRMRLVPLNSFSALIMHVDADIASDAEINCEKPCPPASDTVDALREVVLGWSGDRNLPERVVLCIPSKCIEVWVFIALYPADKCAVRELECRTDPEALLIGKSERLVRGRSGHDARGYKKNASAYEVVAPRVAQSWGYVCRTCTQAHRFSEEFRSTLQGSAGGEPAL